MRRHLQQLAGPLPWAPGFLALAIVAAFVAAAGPGPARAEVLALPPVPHSFEGREQCLRCHGEKGVRPAPANHSGRPEPTCQACHKPAGQPSSGSATPPAASPADRPVTPSTGQAAVNLTGLPSSDTACIACHQATLVTALGSGEAMTATINLSEIAGSVHGRKLTCVACHTDKSAGYPHPKLSAPDRRAYTAAAAAQCTACHKEVAAPFAESVHGRALAAGNSKAASCTDCHGAHNVAGAARLDRRPELCGSCHTVVTETYQASVHGQLLASGRADAASCLACHTKDRSGHSLQAVNDPDGPTSDRHVPATCGTCHGQALKTYDTTFHGRAMRLGVSNEAPNCVDCHGAYGVQRVHAAETRVNETRFANVCAKCHQGANESFAGGWMGHEEPSPGWFPIVFFTERFLFFLTTSVVAFGILHVELDLLRWLVRRRKDGNGKEGK